MAKPCLKLYLLASDGVSVDESTELDITNLIADGGLQIEHEDLDAKNDNTDSGRDVKTGKMTRTRIQTKHVLTVKLRRITGADARHIFLALIPQPYIGNKNPFIKCRYVCPCAASVVTHTMYCSTINYGAQRYNRSTDSICYDGVTFKLIEQ